MSSGAMAECPKGHPLRDAWEAYILTDEYRNSRQWALLLRPMVQAGDPDAEAKLNWTIAPLDQRERHLKGAMWAAFMAGFAAAGGKTSV